MDHFKEIKTSILFLQKWKSGSSDDFLKHLRLLFVWNYASVKKEYSELLEKCMNAVEVLPVVKDGYKQHYSLFPSVKYNKIKFVSLKEVNICGNFFHYCGYAVVFQESNFIGYDNFDLILDIDDKFLFKKPKLNFYKARYYKLYSTIEVQHGFAKENDWLFFSKPNNDNERDGHVFMFRNESFKKQLETYLIPKMFSKSSGYTINNVFKWNRYYDGGTFNSHYDTMFVNNASQSCSLYTLLYYLEPGNTTMYLGEREEVALRITKKTIYIIPHWVKHKVIGEEYREFIKTEIIVPCKFDFTSQDNNIAQKFDVACYLMLKTVRFPELKPLVSKKFNNVNKSRFKWLNLTPYDDPNIMFIKTIYNMSIEYHNNEVYENLNYATDGLFIYAKFNQSGITRNVLRVMVALLYFDLFPNKLVSREISVCECHCPCITYRCPKHEDVKIDENVLFLSNAKSQIDCLKNLETIELEEQRIVTVGNLQLSDMNLEFFFAACQNSTKACQECVSFVPGTNVVRIKQKSFENGLAFFQEKTEWYQPGKWPEPVSSYDIPESKFAYDLSETFIRTIME